MFSGQVSKVLKLAPGFRMLGIRHSFERTVGDWLEVSAASVGRVMHVLFLIVVLGSENIVGVRWIRNRLYTRVCVYHISTKMLFIIINNY